MGLCRKALAVVYRWEPGVVFPQGRTAVVGACQPQVRRHCFPIQVIVLWTWWHSLTKVFPLRQQ